MFADGRITVTWTAPSANGSTINTYKLRWRSGTSSGTDFPAENVIEVQAPGLKYIMVGPAPATVYQFQVQAVNALTAELEETEQLAQYSGIIRCHRGFRSRSTTIGECG